MNTRSLQKDFAINEKNSSKNVSLELAAFHMSQLKTPAWRLAETRQLADTLQTRAAHLQVQDLHPIDGPANNSRQTGVPRPCFRELNLTRNPAKRQVWSTVYPPH